MRSCGRTAASARRPSCAARFLVGIATSADAPPSNMAPCSATRARSPTTAGCRAMALNPTIFKAYDVRGVYPDEINEETARAIGVGFAEYLKPTRIAVGRDMRLSSPAIAAAFIDGVTSQGV